MRQIFIVLNRIFLIFFLFALQSNIFAESLKKLDSMEHYIKYTEAGPNRIGYIVIDDKTSGISEATWLYVKQALSYYKKVKPIFIILELNTPGGEVYAAQKISDALKEFDTQLNIPVVAFINNWAISAGAMLAYSSRFIVVTKDASMGAATPVLASQTGEIKEASEKVTSAIRADFANRASFFDRNPSIAEGMVDKDLILIMRNGKIQKIDQESDMKTTGEDKDILIKPKGKLLTLTAEQLMRYGVADFLLSPTKLVPITLEEEEKGLWPASKNLVFQIPYLSSIPEAEIDKYQMDWKTKFFVFLAHPIISSLLILGLMMGLYFEFTHPGFGLPGSIALISLFLIVLSYLSLDIANWLEVILMLSGLVIVLIDLFVLPTFGLIGIFGLLLFILGLFGVLIPEAGSFHYDFDTKTLNEAGRVVLERLGWFSATIVIGFLLMALASKYVTPKMAKWTRLILIGNEQEANEGYVASKFDQKALGKKGIVLADLKPGGYILIDGEKHQAISQTGYLVKGTEVIVIGGQEESLIVREVV